MEFDDEHERVTISVAELPNPPGRLSVMLPPGYPTVPAPITGPQGLDEHIHLADGTLCLPAHLTDAVDLIDAALHLYAVGEQGSAALQALGVGSAEPRPGFIQVSPRHAMSLPVAIPGGDWGTFTFTGMASSDSLQGTITRVTLGDTDDRAEPSACFRENLAATLDNASKRHKFLWWRTDEERFPTDATELLRFWRYGVPPAAHKWLSRYEQLRARPGRKGRRSNRGLLLYGLVGPEEGPAHDEWHERVIVIASRGNRVTAFPVASFAEIGARVPGAEVLQSKTVAVAGLGMLGGNLALDLARTGVGTLRFADHETVELGNLVRQPYEFGDAGEAKVDALRRQVKRAAPTCAVPSEYLLRQRCGRVATRAAVRHWLSDCDLLVMATGDHNAELHLSELAHEVGVPVVSGWVSLGVWGSLALLTRWGESGCIWCLDQRHDELAVLSEPSGASDLYTPGCGYPTFPGNLVDGRIACSIIGRLAVDALLGLPSAGDLAVTILQTSEGRVGPETTYSRLSPAPACPICSR